jgi:hypothetical protein
VCLELRLCTTLRPRKYRAHNDVRVTVVSIISVVEFLNALLILSAMPRVVVTGTSDPDVHADMTVEEQVIGMCSKKFSDAATR